MNILNWISIFAANLSIGIIFILGIKYMLGQTEERAEYQKVFIPYIIATLFCFQVSIGTGLVSNAPQHMRVILLLIWFVYSVAICSYAFFHKTIFSFMKN